ncbi:family 31 glycoside hydrolase [Cladochytrium replicatum]|nr:family 31 glycoside hydrolase [Cladochytrium replicatum]
MKYTDGAWLVREGVKIAYASEAWSAEQLPGDPSALSCVVATQPIRHKGDTLQGPTLTYTIRAPAPETIEVEIVHFDGGPRLGPTFELFPDKHASNLAHGSSVSISDSPKVAVVSSGTFAARVHLERESFKIDYVRKPAGGANFRDAEPTDIVTSQGWRSMAYVQTNAPSNPQTPFGVFGTKPVMIAQTSLAVGERIYGLGERFTPFVKNGQSVVTWNEDGGTGSEQAYKCVPFYLSSEGYGVFVDSPGKVEFEIGTEKASRVQFALPGQRLKYYIIYGPSLKEVIAKYCLLTGKPALPPPITMGLWLSTSFTTDYDEKTVSHFVDGMRERQIPLSVFHFDCFWMEGFHWCDFKFDSKAFPDPAGFIKRLKSNNKNLKVCLWINPYISQHSSIFREGREKGIFLKRTKEAGGGVWQWDLWQPGMAIVDFTNPAATEWYNGKLQTLLDMGVDYFKTDFGERIPSEGVEWYDPNIDPEVMHNYYTQLYNQAVFNLLEKNNGKHNAVLFARSATAGGQRFPVHWGGDCESTFQAMAESVRGGLSLTSSGFGFWSHDIGGFEGKPDVNLYKRWVAFGLFSTHSRLHGSGSYRVPWQYEDPEATDVLRFFTKAKAALMPYLWAQAVQTHETGVPMMRSLVVEFQNDPGTHQIDLQYMLGDDLMVAPVFSSDLSRDVRYYVPTPDDVDATEWSHLFTGVGVKAGAWASEKHGFMSLPVLVRPGAVIPVSSRDPETALYDYKSELELRVYGATAIQGTLSKTVQVCGEDKDDKATLKVEFAAGKVGVSIVEGSLRGNGWSVVLVGIEPKSVKGVTGGKTVASEPAAMGASVLAGLWKVPVTTIQAGLSSKEVSVVYTP